jgi:hypothetical protein
VLRSTVCGYVAVAVQSHHLIDEILDGAALAIRLIGKA